MVGKVNHAARTLNQCLALAATWNALTVWPRYDCDTILLQKVSLHIYDHHTGVCMIVPGPCDQIGKGCCIHSGTGVNYCSSASNPLTCNVLPEGDAPVQCETCGGPGEPCCFPSTIDVNSAAARDLATAYPACHSTGQACMMDAGSADLYGRCGCAAYVSR